MSRLTSPAARTLRALRAGHGTAAEVAACAGCSVTAVYARLRAARQAGYARRVGWRYSLTPAGWAALRRHEQALDEKFLRQWAV